MVPSVRVRKEIDSTSGLMKHWFWKLVHPTSKSDQSPMVLQESTFLNIHYGVRGFVMPGKESVHFQGIGKLKWGFLSTQVSEGNKKPFKIESPSIGKVLYIMMNITICNFFPARILFLWLEEKLLMGRTFSLNLWFTLFQVFYKSILNTVLGSIVLGNSQRTLWDRCYAFPFCRLGRCTTVRIKNNLSKLHS